MTFEEHFLIRHLFRHSDSIRNIQTFEDLKNTNHGILDLLIQLEELIIYSNYDEYSEYSCGGYHKDGLELLLAARQHDVSIESCDNALFDNLLFFNRSNMQSINSIIAVLNHDKYQTNQLAYNTDHCSDGFLYQGIVLDGINDANHWVLIKTTNCSAIEFRDKLKIYANEFLKEKEFECFLGFYQVKIEADNLLLLNTDFIDVYYLIGKTLSIPQKYIFDIKLNKMLSRN